MKKKQLKKLHYEVKAAAASNYYNYSSLNLAFNVYLTVFVKKENA